MSIRISGEAPAWPSGARDGDLLVAVFGDQTLARRHGVDTEWRPLDEVLADANQEADE